MISWRGPSICLVGATCYLTRPSLFPTAASSIRPCPGQQWRKSTCQQAPAEGQPPVWWPPLLGRVGWARRNLVPFRWLPNVGQILAWSLLEANFWHLAAPWPAIKLPFWDPWETAVLGQILARSFLEANVWHLVAPWPAIKVPVWDPCETAVLGQILARSLLEANFWHLAAPWPAIKVPFWDPWETAVLGQILARSFSKP